jgi:hypothetical protein
MERREAPGAQRRTLADHDAARRDVNALYKTKENFNCYLSPTQAMNLAQNLLMKAQLIEKEGIDDAVVHLWKYARSH